jgi:hypothetical protein
MFKLFIMSDKIPKDVWKIVIEYLEKAAIKKERFEMQDKEIENLRTCFDDIEPKIDMTIDATRKAYRKFANCMIFIDQTNEYPALVSSMKEYLELLKDSCDMLRQIRNSMYKVNDNLLTDL